MIRGLLVATVLGVAVAAAGCGGGMDSTEDFSAFKSFNYSRGASGLSGMMGCGITQYSPGLYLLQRYGSSNHDIVGSQRYISAEELGELQKAFKEVGLDYSEPPVRCEDKYSTESSDWFVWDNVTVSTSECHPPRISKEQAETIVGLLESLSAR